MNQCPEQDMIEAYTEGKIKGKQRKELIRHISTCKECKNAIQAALSKINHKGAGFWEQLFGDFFGILGTIFGLKIDKISKEKEDEAQKTTLEASRNSSNPEIQVLVKGEYWICPSCNEHNLKVYDSCSECGQPVSTKKQD
jgi:hypothetical protein